MFKIKGSLLMLLTLSFGSINAQDLLQHIPDNSSFVIGYKPGALIKKGGPLGAETVKRQFFGRYNEPDENDCAYMFVKKMMSNPADLGINPDGESFIFSSAPISEDEGSSFVCLFPLADVQKFLNATKFCTNNSSVPKYFETNTMKGWLNGNMALASKGNVGMLYVSNDYSHRFSYSRDEDSLYNDERIEEFAEADSIYMNSLLANPEGNNKAAEEMAFDEENFTYESRYEARKKEAEARYYEQFYEGIKKSMAGILDANSSSLADNPNVRAAFKKEHDAWFWLNTNMFTDPMGPYRRAFMPYRSRKQAVVPSSYKPVYLKDNYTFGYLNFNKGNAEASVQYSYNEELSKLLKPAYAVKLDKKLFKYIDASEMLGYMSMSIDMKKLGDSYEKIYLEMLNSMPRTGKDFDNIYPAMELISIFIDKETLFNTLNGNMIFALTGMKEVRVKYKTYEYDDNYNSKEVEVESIEKQPELVLAASIGNQDRAERIFNAVKKFTAVTEIKKDVLQISGDRHFKVNVFIVKTADAFIITNSSTLATSDLAAGIEKSKRLSKADQKKMQGHNLYANWDMDKTFNEIARVFGGSSSSEMLNKLSARFDNLEAETNKLNDNTMETLLRVNFKNGETNGLEQLLELMKQMQRY